MTNQNKAVLLAILTVFFWGSAATAFKLTLELIDIVTIICLASGTSFLIFLTAGILGKKFANITIKELAKSAIFGFLNPFIYYLVLLKAYSLLPAQQAQPLNFIWPILIVLLSIPLLHHKLKLFDAFALLISFLGVLIISTKGNFSLMRISNPLGVILATSSSLIWALYFVLNVRDERDDIRKLALNFFFGFIFSTILFFAIGHAHPINMPGVGGALYIGTFEMGITFLIWIKALKLCPNSTFLNNIIYLTPFVALVFIRIFLQEAIHFSAILGLIIITSGIIFHKMSHK